MDDPRDRYNKPLKVGDLVAVFSECYKGVHFKVTSINKNNRIVHMMGLSGRCMFKTVSRKPSNVRHLEPEEMI